MQFLFFTIFTLLRLNVRRTQQRNPLSKSDATYSSYGITNISSRLCIIYIYTDFLNIFHQITVIYLSALLSEHYLRCMHDWIEKSD